MKGYSTKDMSKRKSEYIPSNSRSNVSYETQA